MKTSNLISSNILCLQWQDWISRVTFSGSKKYDALWSNSPHLKSTKVRTFWFKAFFPKNFRHSFGTTKMVKCFHRTIYIRMVCWNSITGIIYNRTISPIQNTKQNWTKLYQQGNNANENTCNSRVIWLHHTMIQAMPIFSWYRTLRSKNN